MAEDKNRFKETLEWLHHAYWIREFLVSTGIAVGIMKWIVTNVTALSQFGWAIFLSLAGLFMYLADALRKRKRETTKPGVSNEAGSSNLQEMASLVVHPPASELPSDVDIKKWFANAYRTTQEAEIRKNFYLLARKEQPTDPEKFYLEFIGVGFLAALFDGVWWPMYRSQLEALLELNRNFGQLPLSKIQRFYEEAKEKYPEDYERVEITFDDWIAYLTSNTLIIRYPSDMIEITQRGKEFLKYLTHWGRTSSVKRL